MKKITGGIHQVEGVESAAVHAGFRYNPNKKDLTMLYFPRGATVAGAFTQNLVKAWPVQYNIELLAQKEDFKAILINSGNANACNGDVGMQVMEASINVTADALGVEADDVLISSTGVIGAPLTIEPFEEYVPLLVENLQSESSVGASEGILTTDTKTKEVAYEAKIDEETVRIGAMAKGSGMINPNLGTMLAYIVTDVSCNQATLQELLLKAVQSSFNSITVDGDTSTNDTVLLASTEIVEIELNDANLASLQALITQVCTDLAQLIVADGEGATKFVTIIVDGAETDTDAKQIAGAIASSSLVKTALYGEDPNWGRILSAVGSSGVMDIDPQTINVTFVSEWGECLVCKNSSAADFDKDLAHTILTANDVEVKIDLQVGVGSATVWTSDLSHDYVTINAEYHT